jgi:hypothetical protein
MYPSIDTSVTPTQTEEVASAFEVEISMFTSLEDHACGLEEPGILDFIKNKEGLNETT